MQVEQNMILNFMRIHVMNINTGLPSRLHTHARARSFLDYWFTRKIKIKFCYAKKNNFERILYDYTYHSFGKLHQFT